MVGLYMQRNFFDIYKYLRSNPLKFPFLRFKKEVENDGNYEIVPDESVGKNSKESNYYLVKEETEGSKDHVDSGEIHTATTPKNDKETTDLISNNNNCQNINQRTADYLLILANGLGSMNEEYLKNALMSTYMQPNFCKIFD